LLAAIICSIIFIKKIRQRKYLSAITTEANKISQALESQVE
jgi:hypothetical protein